jgi:hypothetical protein
MRDSWTAGPMIECRTAPVGVILSHIAELLYQDEYRSQNVDQHQRALKHKVGTSFTSQCDLNGN